MARVGKHNQGVTVILSRETYKELKKWAKLKDWSLSQSARNLIEAGLAEEKLKDGDKEQTP